MGYKQYCKDYENIENYEKAKADNFKCWCCHHRLETHNSDGERRAVDITAAELIALGMYYNRPASELIFMKRSEHNNLHKKGNTYRLGKHHTEESRIKMSEAHKGKHHSEETKKKMSEVWSYDKHFTIETKNKISELKKGNKNVRGKRWFNNGKINIRAKECPEGFVFGRLSWKNN